MRLFIAIDLPADIKEYLKSIPVPGRIVKDYHLTLKFLGEAQSEPVITALSKIKFEEFRITLSEMGVFPNEKRPRVVWVGVEPKDDVLKLHKEIENVLGKDKKFHPHITLSRVKERVKLNEIEQKDITVSTFSLIKSTLTPTGPIYETIKTFKSTS